MIKKRWGGDNKPSLVDRVHAVGTGSIEEDKHPKDGWEHQHLVVETQPGEVQTHLERNYA